MISPDSTKTRCSIKAYCGPLLLLSFIFLQACTEGGDRAKPEVNVPQKVVEPVSADTSKRAKEVKIWPSYQLDSLTAPGAVDSLKNWYKPEQLEIIAALNRLDPWRLQQAEAIVIPDSMTADFGFYAPFPDSIDVLRQIPRLVLISKRIQAMGLYENGRLIRWGPVSSGKETTETPAGLFYGNYKAREKISTIDSDWIMPFYFNYMNFEGIGTHQYSLPGYPASHGCVRLREADAMAIYDWAKQWELDDSQQVILRNGTPFMVIGSYDFAAKPPWLELALDPKANALNPQELEIIAAHAARYHQDPRNKPLEMKEGQRIDQGT